MNKTVIITGASRGIGRATAIEFASHGYNVVLNSLNGGKNLVSAVDLCNQVLSKNADESLSAIGVKGDVSDPAFASELMSGVNRLFGGIDILINNAGISYIGLIQDTDDATWQKIMNTNLSSVHYCTRSVIPYMLSKKSGKIINISSVWGNRGASCEAAYSASKGGLEAYTKAAAKELAPSGISVNAIACGCIDTDMNKCFSSEELKNLADEIPIGRLGTAKEAAEAIFNTALFPTYLTGQIITFDGGWM